MLKIDFMKYILNIHGNKIIKSKTLEDNKIRDSNIIMMIPFEEIN